MMTLSELMDQFSDEASCKAYLVERRWPDGVCCPRCGSVKVATLKQPFKWQCRACNKNGYRFSVTSGTIFENTNVPLRTWFQVLYLMLESKKGMSALQIHRTIGSGSYETAWYMCHRIRAAMKSGTFMKLSGIVEVDETYIGGKAKNRHPGNRGKGKGYGTPPKTAVIGAIARKGNVVAQVIEDADQWTMQKFVRATVNSGVSIVATDQHQGYKRLDRFGYKHETVNHAKGEYVKQTVVGSIHTASLDSFWSLLKRGVVGTYHKVSKDYLPFYLAEFSFRHNNRRNPDVFDLVLAQC